MVSTTETAMVKKSKNYTDTVEEEREEQKEKSTNKEG